MVGGRRLALWGSPLAQGLSHLPWCSKCMGAGEWPAGEAKPPQGAQEPGATVLGQMRNLEVEGWTDLVRPSCEPGQTPGPP